MIWESPAHGHRALVYTADGHLFRTWHGPTQSVREGVDYTLGPGIKQHDWSKSGAFIAVGDFSERITVLNAPAFTEVVSLQYSNFVTPSDSLQVCTPVIPCEHLLTTVDLAGASQYNQ